MNINIVPATEPATEPATDKYGMSYVGVSTRPYYNLNIYVPPELRDMYIESARVHNNSIIQCLVNSCQGLEGTDFNAGFDLFCPEKIEVHGTSVKVDHKIACAMRKVEPGKLLFDMSLFENGKVTPVGAPNYPVGYYLYPRSSTGTKTPLRLCNSVGIIDSGYRGNIIAAFDVRPNEDDSESRQFSGIKKYQRLTQICPPDLCHPIYVNIIGDDVNELGNTLRGTGGFGSTGE